MALQSWDIVVHGNTHHVVVDRNPDSGKQLVRVDGHIAIKPFADTRCEQPLEIGGRPFLLRVDDGRYTLEEKTSRYIDSSAPREPSNLGAVTIARGLEHITVITDEAILRIEKLSDAMKVAGASAAGGGILGAVLTNAAAAIAQKVVNEAGAPYTVKQQLKSFSNLDTEAVCRFEHLPFDLIALFDDLDLSSRVVIVPRRAISALEVLSKKIVAIGAAGKKQKFDLVASAAQALDHLCAAGYPLALNDVARAGDAAREERERRRHAAPAPPPIASATPPPAENVPAGRNFSGLPEVRWTSPLLTVIGREPPLAALMEEDAKAYAAVYPKTLMRRMRADGPFRDLGVQRYDIVHLHATFDEKTRFKETGGFVISLKDLIVKLIDLHVRMLWIASPNDRVAAQETLEWASGQNLFLAFTTERGPDYPALLQTALSRLAAGEPLSSTWPQIAAVSSSSCEFFGRNESIFRPK